MQKQKVLGNLGVKVIMIIQMEDGNIETLKMKIPSDFLNREFKLFDGFMKKILII